jgi:hypothetical protein
MDVRSDRNRKYQSRLDLLMNTLVGVELSFAGGQALT